MVTINNQAVAAGLDDGDELESTGLIDGTDAWALQYRSYTDNTYRYWSFHRWAIAIPQFATIGTCLFYPHLYSAAADDANFNIHFEKAATPAALDEADTSQITEKTRTTISIPWVADGIAAGGVGRYYSPELKTALQEVVDLYTTVYIGMITRPNQDADKTFASHTFERGGGYMGQIYIEYTSYGGEFSGVAVAECDGVAVEEITGV